MSNRTAALTVLMALGSAGFVLSACSRSPVAPSALVGGATAGSQAQRAGQGNTPAHLTRAGWTCLNVPGHGVHCQDPQASFGESVHIQVKVFDTDDPSSDSAVFRGTESLIRADLYKGQPCLPGHGEYFLLPFGYYACHHFDF